MGQIALQVPQVGVANATEDVKVASDFTTLQTLLNGNLDPTNMTPGGGIMHLAFRSVVGSTSLAVGDWAVCVPSISVALPAPTANGLIALTMGAGVTGSAQVTVTGTNIWLPSAPSSVSSFTQGSQLTTLVLQSDGTSWITMAGQRDTGWLALTFLNSYSAGSPVPSARLVGDRVELKGTIHSASPIAGSTQFATIPVGFRPPVTLHVPQAYTVSATKAGVAIIDTVGVITGDSGVGLNGAVGDVAYLDGIGYSLS